MKTIMLLFSIIGFMSSLTATAQTGHFQRCHPTCEQIGTEDYGTCMDACLQDTSCLLDDQQYPEGTIYDSYVCRQGEWMTNQCLLNNQFYSEGETYGNLICRQGEWITQ